MRYTSDMNARALTLGAVLLAACSHKVALFCDENTPCTDPARPFCDLEGEFPASEGIGNTCIADPSPDGGVSESDAGPPITVTQLAVGGVSCALLSNGRLRCWGEGTDGQLGYGNV